MMKHRLYFAYGIVVIIVASVAELRGWSFSRATEGRVDAPRSVRDNPGSYRPVYIGTGGRYMRGK